ncbi:MAG TPA: M23 family metallopeptidase [Puia sp.]|nr:M23 family metallopeptidase [Puia sp.]
MKHFWIRTLFVIVYYPAFSQVFPAKNYPKGYFRDPLNIPITLAGNFGELRPNHYHMGLDIRTNLQENLPVLAAADGYIAHIKVEPAGFGQAVYINHPNGYTTVYGHLNGFFPALSAYVKQQQYKVESWRIFLDIPPEMFPVKKSNLVAYSGNTGGSQAPHVHFEIRSTSDDINKNPMLFGLPVGDNTSPVILRLGVYDRTKSVYEQSPRIFRTKRSGNFYHLVNGILTVNSPKVSFGISAFDTESGRSNRLGIYEADLYDNKNAVIGFQMDNISYDKTRNVNAHIDFKTKTETGLFLQQLFQLYGYINSIYHPVSGDGVIDLSDGSLHAITIEVRDPVGNRSVIEFKVHYKAGSVSTWQPRGKKFYPMMLDGFESDDCSFYIGEKCLYDSVRINYSSSASTSPNVVSKVSTIGASYIPLQDSFLVRIKANTSLSAEKKDRTVMERITGSNHDVKKVEWQNDWASAHFRDFGRFQLVVDEIPPVIVPVGFYDGTDVSRAKKIAFIIRDNMGSFKKFRAELDGSWLLFSNDKGKSFIYKFDEHCPKGKHELKISVEDEAGNIASKMYRFTR